MVFPWVLRPAAILSWNFFHAREVSEPRHATILKRGTVILLSRPFAVADADELSLADSLCEGEAGYRGGVMRGTA